MFNLVKHWKLIILVINVMIFTISAFSSAEPLNVAAKEDDLDEVKRLIEKGANIEVRDASKSTPLYNAVDRGNKDVVEFLILKGANVNVNCTVLDYTPLHRATTLFGGDKEMVSLLIANGANVNKASKNGTTPLIFAERRGAKDMMELLIKHGAQK